MSEAITRTITCKCGNKFDMEVFLSVNVTVDPGLKEKVLKGEINSGVCPKCGQKYQILTSFLYDDMDRDFMVEINPQEIGIEKLGELIKKLEKKYTLEDAERRRKKAGKEWTKTEKEIERGIGMTKEEWFALPYEESMKVHKRFLEKEAEKINKLIETAKTPESKEKLAERKKKLEKMTKEFKKNHKETL